MQKNVGKIDRIARLVIAAVLVGLYALGMVQGTMGMVVLAIGAVMFITAVISFCPLYTVMGKCCKPSEGKKSCCGGCGCHGDEASKDEQKN